MPNQTDSQPAQTHFCKETFTRKALPPSVVEQYDGTCKMRPLTDEEREIYKETNSNCNCIKPTVYNQVCLYCGEFYD